MSPIVLSFTDSVTIVPTMQAKSTTALPWWGFLFIHPIMSPVLWSSSFFVSLLILMFSSTRMVLPSISHGFIFLLLVISAGLGQGVQTLIYPSIAPLYDGGWMPSLQRTLLGNGIFVFLGLSLYLCWWSLWPGIPALLTTIFYAWRCFPRQRNRNPFKSLTEWLNAKERIQVTGIHWVERFCVMGSIFAILLGSCAFLETMVPIKQPGYTVKVLGKAVHSGGRGGPTYTVSLSGWPAAQQKLTQRVAFSEYEALRPGQTYRMLTWRGLLGTERLKQFK